VSLRQLHSMSLAPVLTATHLGFYRPVTEWYYTACNVQYFLLLLCMIAILQ